MYSKIQFFSLIKIVAFLNFVTLGYASPNFLDNNINEGSLAKITPRFNDELVVEDALKGQYINLFDENMLFRNQTVFNGLTMLAISSYLGRQEVGRMQQVNKDFYSFYTKGKEGLELWEGYAHQLQIDNKDPIKIHELINQIKTYYRSQIQKLVFTDNIRFKFGGVTSTNFINNTYVGWAVDTQNNNHARAVIWKDGTLQPLEIINDTMVSAALAINADGTIITGWANDGLIYTRTTAVMWKNETLQPLENFNNGEGCEATAINADGTLTVGWANDGLNNNRTTAVIWRNGLIHPLEMMNNGGGAHATAINADGSIILGWAQDGHNENKYKPVLWSHGTVQNFELQYLGNITPKLSISADGNIISGSIQFGKYGNVRAAAIWNKLVLLNLYSYPFDKPHDELDAVKFMSNNGSDFIINSNTGKIYKAHIPRNDLWKMG